MKKIKKLTKWEKENQDGPGYKYVGHYKRVPIFTHPDVPDGVIYFFDNDIKLQNFEITTKNIEGQNQHVKKGKIITKFKERRFGKLSQPTSGERE